MHLKAKIKIVQNREKSILCILKGHFLVAIY